MVAVRKLQGPHPEFGYRPPDRAADQRTVAAVEIIGSVAPEEVPQVPDSRQEGIWARVSMRAIADHENGRVTVIKLTDPAVVKRLRNGMSSYMRKAGYLLHPVVVDDGKDGIRVFLELRVRAPETEEGAE